MELRQLTRSVLVLLLPACALAGQAKEPEPGSPQAVELAVKLVVEADKAAREGRVARALKIARRVARLAPAAPGAQRMLGDLYLTVGDCAWAMKYFGLFARIGKDAGEIARARRLIKECETSKRRRGNLKVTVLPAQAAVRVIAPWQEAPVAAGQGEILTALPMGEYRVRASLPGHKELDAKVRVLPAKTTKVADSLALRSASLTVRTKPPGGKVKIDGGPVGQTPVKLSPMAPGDHLVEIELAGYKDTRSMARVLAGQDVALTLRPEPAPARFNVRADAPDARVELDGTIRCQAPCDVEVEATGEHRMRVLSPGYIAAERMLTPGPGESGELQFNLQESPGTVARRGRTRWAIGLGAVGAALAIGGGVALGAGFSTSSDADDAYGRYQDAERAEDASSFYTRSQDLDEKAQNQQLVGYGLLGGAVLSGLAATLLWATADSAAASAETAAP